MFRFRQRLFVWLAFFATLIGALAPAVSQAMASGKDSSFFVVVCSALGTHRVEITSAEAAQYAGVVESNSDQNDVGFLEACPYCVTHGSSFGLPPIMFNAVVGVLPSIVDVPLLFLVAPRPLFAWTPSHPRAPPLLA